MVKIPYFEEELEIPPDVKVVLKENGILTVKGPEGEVTKDFSHVRGFRMELKDNKLIFSAHFPKRKTLALAKTIINIIDNLIKGVQLNFKYYCKICYSHFPFNAEVITNKKEIHFVNFLGERKPRIAKYLDNVKVKIEGDDVILEGPDKETLGQTAANMKLCCKIKKKDPRVFQDGVYLYKKQRGDEILWEIK